MLEIKELTTKVNEKSILNGVNLNIKAGEVRIHLQAAVCMGGISHHVGNHRPQSGQERWA